jgi:hypothetical protein
MVDYKGREKEEEGQITDQSKTNRCEQNKWQSETNELNDKEDPKDVTELRISQSQV